jgi:hypothetical protein
VELIKRFGLLAHFQGIFKFSVLKTTSDFFMLGGGRKVYVSLI